MLEILSARNTQSTVSGINYRKYLHQWICLPDMQVYVQARKVNEQLSDVSSYTAINVSIFFPRTSTNLVCFPRPSADLLQGRPELAEGYRLLCLGHSGDSARQACRRPAERCNYPHLP